MYCLMIMSKPLTEVALLTIDAGILFLLSILMLDSFFLFNY